jgi:hypothetical protein
MLSYVGWMMSEGDGLDEPRRLGIRSWIPFETIRRFSRDDKTDAADYSRREESGDGGPADSGLRVETSD